MASWGVIQWRVRTKKKLIESLGGKCNRCGYNTTYYSLDFHHKEANDKQFNISELLSHPRKLDLIAKEVAKCVLLCKNCHGELHAGLWSLSEISTCTFEGLIDEPTGACVVCAKQVFRGALTCGRACSAKRAKRVKWFANLQTLVKNQGVNAVAKSMNVSEGAVRKRLKRQEQTRLLDKNANNRPLAEELRFLLWSLPTTEIAKRYNVSDKAVSKWANKYGLTKPPRGYWAKLQAKK